MSSGRNAIPQLSRRFRALCQAPVWRHSSVRRGLLERTTPRFACQAPHVGVPTLAASPEKGSSPTHRDRTTPAYPYGRTAPYHSSQGFAHRSGADPAARTRRGILPGAQHRYHRAAQPRASQGLRAAGGAVFGFGLHLRWFIASRLGLRVGHREVGVAARVEAPFRRQAQVAGRLPAQQGRQLLERDVA